MSELAVPPVVEAPVETPKEPAISPQFEMLAKRESQIVRQQLETKREREELDKMRSEMQKDREEFQRFQERKKTAKLNPISALEELGLTYEELTQYQLNGGVPQGDVIAKSVQEQLAEFRKELAAEHKRERETQDEQAKKQAADQVAEFKSNLTDFVKSKGDEFEYINQYNQHDLVYDTIVEHYNKTLADGKPRVLSSKEAADLVEKHLEDLVEQGTKTKKFASRQSPQPPADPKAAAQSVAKTLTNSMNSSSVPSSLPAQTETDRIKRALAALGG